MSKRTADLGGLLNKLCLERNINKRKELREQAFDLLEEIEREEIGE